jgi:lysophospholipid acyltransferase (LPLAT)-like uncharacterized protein
MGGSRARQQAAQGRLKIADGLVRWGWYVLSWPVGVAFKLHAVAILRTSRVSTGGPGADYHGPAIYVNWHRYLPFLVMHHGQHRRWLMVSPAPYMDTIARYSRWAGLRVVRGASGDKGRAALDELLHQLRRGESVFLAVDGPAGPALKVKRGCVDLARAAGVPVIPVAYASRRGRHNPKRWDGWLMIKAFDTIAVTYGVPVFIEAGEGDAEAIARVEAGLIAVSGRLAGD